MIWFSSDLHFCHDREFIYGPRGFKSIDEMNAEIVKRWNSVVSDGDTCYILGDLMLKDNEQGIDLVNSLKGTKHIIFGNHDTAVRIREYGMKIENLMGSGYADMLSVNGYHLFLTHYPCLTGSLEKSSLKQCVCNLFGHTHDKRKFFEDRPYMYNVALDAHDCYPVSLETVLADMESKVLECKEML